MGLRHKLRQLLTSPAAAVLEGAIRDLIEEVIDSRGLVRRAEIEAIEHRVDALRRELGERRADLVGLTQSLDALARELDDDLPLVHDDDTAARVDALEAERRALTDRLERAHDALGAAAAQVASFTARMQAAEERADKALHAARSALSTAEAAADGVSALEHRAVPT